MQETTEFNKKFEAFNRSTMYGTDIISVIGMAISNNMIYNQQKYIIQWVIMIQMLNIR